MWAALLVMLLVEVRGLVPDCPDECLCLSQSQVLCNTGGLTEIPKNLPVTVQHLSLTKNSFPLIRTDAFNGLKGLTRLHLDGNNISVIKPFAFRGLPRLKEISIQHTPLKLVSQFAFAGLQNVSHIFLGHNHIEKVEGYAFAGTSNVRLLLLNNNPLKRVEASAFSGLTHVEHIILPSGVKVIEPDAFNGLDTVGLLKLAFMDLQALQTNTFHNLIRVHVLTIQESDLGVIEEGAFEGLSLVTNLNIINNKIDAIRGLVIKASSRVRTLRFHGNHLLETPTLSGLVIEGVEHLSVINNHFPCDCHVHTLLASTLANTSDFKRRNFCISPLEVNGRTIESLDLDTIGRCSDQMTRDTLEGARGPAHTPHLCPLLLFLLLVIRLLMF
ncbi:leucine-rich repeat and immunoglobulin-like domain-containing nogo receptor-interacting protein 1 [Neocloeon triangulifer]|uniref:leucine-rich repeat and immunoglobulin-like domain-containing nogo receptor-interacting protein 1 n=1 Tax=Neocloeon triangulifer TaxID=2078957 RepID=UPI00286EB972|nr:leucine-rich repeat and immunoglobulin-like domain-containing nogo receptor-interacting protein 1 [Neocloeon triangulifer]